jgi:glycosyltransferase involved in cell wall biosynthesis
VLEFSACNKPVLSNPLREFDRLNLPNVRFTDGAGVRDWQAALADPESFAPFDQAALARAIKPFDWNRSAGLLAGAMGLSDVPGREPAPVDTRIQGVVHFQRKPTGDFHSIEKLFHALRGAMSEHAAVLPEECPEVARGVLPRWRNLRWAKRAAGEVNHITGDVHYLALGLPPERTILTVHDCIALHRGSALRRAILRKLYFQWPVARAAIVTTISQATKDELVRVTGCNPDSVRVIPDCVSNVFQPVPKQFDTVRPTVLLIGTLPHKNLERTVEALSAIPCRVRIIGRLTGQQQALLAKHCIDYTNDFDLTTAQMARAYSDCDVVGFASLFEGFGMPILEGQAVGRARRAMLQAGQPVWLILKTSSRSARAFCA